MMKIKHLIFCAAMTLMALALSSSGCSKDDPKEDVKTYNLSLASESVSLSYAAATETVTVTADCDWGVSSAASWCTVSPSGGISGTTTVKISVAENPSDEVRETTLTFRYGSNTKTFSVRQNYKIEEVKISDAAFKAALLAAYDTDKDGVLSTVEAAGISEIKVPGKGISAMPELGTAFKDITYLDCSGNSLTQLDLGNLTKLKYLDCSNNKLTGLDISTLVNLETFNCTGNTGLTEIKVWTGFKAGENFSIPSGAAYVEPDIETPAGYTLVWQDEFNEGDKPSTSEWWYETGAGGWGNNEIQNYVSQKTPSGTGLATIEDGILTIKTVKEGGSVYSIRMNTSKGWTYGWFEARIKVSDVPGSWPAFWMMPKNYKTWPGDGEIDIMEYAVSTQGKNKVSSSIHCNAYNWPKGTQKTHAMGITNAATEFHVYALEWTESEINFYVDGKKHLTFKNEGKGYDVWPFDAPFYLKLNMAWGGNMGGTTNESGLPALYQIDYVRVFQKQ